jgi:integrase
MRMQGHVTKKVNKWYVVLFTGYDEKGKKKYKWFSGFSTKKEAQKALAQKLHEINTGTYVDSSKDRLSEYLEKWLEYKRSRIKQRTYEIYKRTIRLHVDPHVGKIKLIDLKSAHLRDLYNKLAQKSLSNRYISQIHTLLHDALKTAVKWDLVPRNVSDMVDPPRPERKKFNVWSLEDVQRFLNAPEVKEHRFYVAFLLALTTGMRQGEILGLQWRDIDFANNTIHVQRTLTRIGDGETFGPPKSESSNRVIYVPPEVIEVLRKHKAKQNEVKLLMGAAYNNLDLVIARTNGNIVTQAFLRKKFVDLITKLDMPYIRFHDLRHTHATIMLELGEKLKVIQDRLGHSALTTTADIYTHVSKTLQKGSADILSEAIFHAK